MARQLSHITGLRPCTTTSRGFYGINFKHMPELEWPYGYPMALVVMLLAAIVPYMYFKWGKLL